MPRRKIDIARNRIEETIKNIERTVFDKEDLHGILETNRDRWGLGSALSTPRFIEFLLSETILEKLDIASFYVRYVRYVKKEFSNLELGASLREGSYLTHFSAMYLNGLTDQIPKRVYANKEQPSKPKQKTNKLSQKSIDYAFKREPRITSKVGTYNNNEIFLLEGMNTNNTGVVTIKGHYNELLPVTNVERTLLDITVRPFYSGGVFEVQGAYKKARNTVSIKRLLAYYKELDYVYPYHQAIGFYLENSGVYEPEHIRIFLEFPKEFNFYLTYRIKQKEYSKKWRLYYPYNI